MSAALPRPPGAGTPASSEPRPQTATGSAGRAGKSGISSRTRATPLPMILAIGSVLLGILALLFIAGQAQTPQALAWGLTGYLLAGFAPPLLLGWDSASQRRGLKNPNFSARRGYSSALRLIVLIGILAAVFHLITIADVLALRLSEWLYVTGLMTQ